MNAKIVMKLKRVIGICMGLCASYIRGWMITMKSNKLPRSAFNFTLETMEIMKYNEDIGYANNEGFGWERIGDPACIIVTGKQIGRAHV